MPARLNAPRLKKQFAIPGLSILILIVVVLATADGGNPQLYPPDPHNAVAVYLIDNGMHSDLAFPAKSLSSGTDPVAAMARGAGGKSWIVMGWGDEKFYTQEGFSTARALDALRALFMPGNRSVVRVEGLRVSPDKLYVASAVHRIFVSPDGLAAMRRRIDASMALSISGNVQPLREGQSGGADAIFYRSVENFSLLHLCNHWTAKVLHAGGLPTTPVIDTIPDGLKLDLRLRADA